MPESAPVNEVDVWIAQPDMAEIQERLTAYRTLLSADEVMRADRFLQPDDAVRFIVGRALARTMLSRYADVAPRDWPLVIDAHGRPHLGHRPFNAPDLRFNLTHTRGLVACAVTVGREVGIDVEHVKRQVAHDVPERFFSPQEVAELRALSTADQQVVFFDYWTLKEAYIKARGLGLAVPLRQFTFVRSSARPTIAFAPELHDDPGSWQFAQFWPTAEHRMAVAVRRTGDDLLIHVEQLIPEVPA